MLRVWIKNLLRIWVKILLKIWINTHDKSIVFQITYLSHSINDLARLSYLRVRWRPEAISIEKWETATRSRAHQRRRDRFSRLPCLSVHYFVLYAHFPVASGTFAPVRDTRTKRVSKLIITTNRAKASRAQIAALTGVTGRSFHTQLLRSTRLVYHLWAWPRWTHWQFLL